MTASAGLACDDVEVMNDGWQRAVRAVWVQARPGGIAEMTGLLQ